MKIKANILTFIRIFKESIVKKIIFPLFLLGNLAFCDNDNTYHGVIVDEGQKGEIFGQLGVIDGTEAFGDPYVTRNTSGGCIKKAAD